MVSITGSMIGAVTGSPGPVSGGGRTSGGCVVEVVGGCVVEVVGLGFDGDPPPLPPVPPPPEPEPEPEPPPLSPGDVVGVVGPTATVPLDVNRNGARPMAASRRPSKGPGALATPWSNATKPHAAPSSRNPNTLRHRSANDAFLPLSANVAPTSVSPAGRPGVSSAPSKARSPSSSGSSTR